MDRIVVITGANSGIGKAASRQFAASGDRVIMACRSIARSQEVRDCIVAETSNQQVDLMQLDTASGDSISSFAEALAERYSRVDVLINNAAYVEHGRPYTLGPEGIEITFATNVLGPHRLMRQLEPMLQHSDDPRILNIGSNIIKHFFNPKMELDFDTIHGLPDGVSEPSVYQRYCRSKMALLMLTFETARRLEPAGIRCNYLHVNGAKLSRETIAKMTLGYRIIGRLQSLILRKPEYMASNYFELTTAERFRKVSGVCFNDRLEAMQPGDAEHASAFEQIRFPLGRSHYPAHADKRDLQKRVARLCEVLCSA